MTMMMLLSAVIFWIPLTIAFVPNWTPRLSLSLSAQLSTLPQGISPFEKSNSKYIGISQDIRTRALTALQKAMKNGVLLQEIEFPPLLDSGKSQFDDFDNVQELNKNVDWCVELLPKLDGEIWFLLPDLKECELAKEQWTGQSFRKAAKFTTIEAVTNHYVAGSYRCVRVSLHTHSAPSLFQKTDTSNTHTHTVMKANHGEPRLLMVSVN